MLTIQIWNTSYSSKTSSGTEEELFHEGDLHLRYCKHFCYRLRPTIVAQLLKREEEWGILDKAVKSFSADEQTFGNNRDADRKRSLLYRFLLEDYLLREFREIVGADCCRLMLEFLGCLFTPQEKLFDTFSLSYSATGKSCARVCEDGAARFTTSFR